MMALKASFKNRQQAVGNSQNMVVQDVQALSFDVAQDGAPFKTFNQ
jgi:hypothetical protein